MTFDTNPTSEDQPLNTRAAVKPAQARRRAVRRLARAEYFYLLALALFAALAFFAHLYAYFGWDLRVTQTLQSLSVPGLRAAMIFVSLFGNGSTPYALTALVVIIFFCLRRRSEAAGLLLCAAGSGIINSTLKILIARPRPDATLVNVMQNVATQSFPSGHVTFYVCFFGFLFFVAHALLPARSIKRTLAMILLALPVTLVGLSRVYLGAHWASDTLGAYLLSGTWLAFSLHAYRRWKARATFHKTNEDDIENG